MLFDWFGYWSLAKIGGETDDLPLGAAPSVPEDVHGQHVDIAQRELVKKAPMRRTIFGKGLSRTVPASLNNSFGATRNRWLALTATCAFHKSFKSWLLAVVPPRSTSAMTPLLAESG